MNKVSKLPLMNPHGYITYPYDGIGILHNVGLEIPQTFLTSVTESPLAGRCGRVRRAVVCAEAAGPPAGGIYTASAYPQGAPPLRRTTDVRGNWAEQIIHLSHAGEGPGYTLKSTTLGDSAWFV